MRMNLRFIHVLFTAILLTCSSRFQSVYAQWYDPAKVNAKAREIYEAAYQKAVEADYTGSMKKLEEALQLEPRYVEVYLSRAGIYADMKNYPASVADFEQAFALDSVFSNEYRLPFSISLAGTGQFERALQTINRFLQIPDLNKQSLKAANYRKSVYEFALQFNQQHPDNAYQFNPEDVGPGINTADHEYYPSLTVDGKHMVITRRIQQDEDFYASDWINGAWTTAQSLPGKINTNFNEGAQNISQDGQWLVFTGCNYPEGMGSCDLYISYLTKSGSWTEPENLGSRINSEYWESSPSLSPDKRDLYFSSSRPGGFGGKDLWVSHRQPNGQWGEAQNLGPQVNTDGDESCAFIHADNHTLYFNSNGHPGYGITDLFVSRKTGENSWTKPDNLGYPINTIDDEGSLIVAADGVTAYYASDRGKAKGGGMDIYRFNMRPEMQAQATTWVKGRVYNKKTGEGLPSSVQLTEMNSRNPLNQLQTDEDGLYLITLPEGKSYVFNVNRKGFLFYSDHFDIKAASVDSFLTVDIPLEPIEPGAAIVLKNIFFASNQTTLDPNSQTELNLVIRLMQDNPTLRIMISGHTDNTGNKSDNLKLSLGRAQAVTTYLTSQGIAASRLVAKGFGDSKPVAPNDSEQGKSLNRRTELNVLQP